MHIKHSGFIAAAILIILFPGCFSCARPSMKDHGVPRPQRVDAVEKGVEIVAER